MKINEIISTRYNQTVWIIFCIVVFINITLASMALRTAYLDGAPNFLSILDCISNGQFHFFTDSEHPRIAMNFLNELPTNIAGLLFHIENKFVLGFIDTFSHLFLPFLALYWNYKITIKTGRKDVFAASLFLYSFFVMLYQIWPFVELSLCTMLLMLLFNYLCCTDREYSKFDIFLILFISVLACQSHEVIIFVAPLLILTVIQTLKKTKNKTVKVIKTISAIFITFAGIYNIWFMLNTPGELGEISRFLHEFIIPLKYFLFSSNILLSSVGILLLIFCNTEKPFGKISLIAVNVMIFGTLAYLMNPPDRFINPNMENTTRTFILFAFPLTVFVIILTDYFKKHFSDTFLTNLITVSITVGIAHNIWQINNTYWWNNAVNSLKNDLITNNKPLFIPEEHNFYFDFGNAKTRYISPFSYTATSVIFSDLYEIKHILVQPKDNSINPGAGRDNLFYIEDKRCLNLPAAIINEKNKFWDLRKSIKALNEYNQKNIQQSDL